MWRRARTRLNQPRARRASFLRAQSQSESQSDGSLRPVRVDAGSLPIDVVVRERTDAIVARLGGVRVVAVRGTGVRRWFETTRTRVDAERSRGRAHRERALSMHDVAHWG